MFYNICKWCYWWDLFKKWNTDTICLNYRLVVWVSFPRGAYCMFLFSEINFWKLRKVLLTINLSVWCNYLQHALTASLRSHDYPNPVGFCFIFICAYNITSPCVRTLLADAVYSVLLKGSLEISGDMFKVSRGLFGLCLFPRKPQTECKTIPPAQT